MQADATKASWRPLLILLAGLTLLSLLATGCGLTPAHTPRASDQWSNGKLLGTARLNNQVAFQVAEMDGDVSIFMVWVGLEDELNFARLNERTEVVTQRSLNLPSNSPIKPQLLIDTTGQLHLIWLDKEDRGLQLFYASLSADGEVIQEAMILSPAEKRVAHSAMVLNPVGRTVEIFWSDNTPFRPGCFHAALDWSGMVVIPAEELIADGIMPAVQTDRQGFVHLAWRVEPEGEEVQFHYAIYDPQRRVLGPTTLASEPLMQMSLLGGPTAGARFVGPQLGLDESSVYLAWTVEARERGGLTALTFYQAFHLPSMSISNETIDYEPLEAMGEAVHVLGADPALTGNPSFLKGQPVAQALACYTQAQSQGNVETLQIAVIDVVANQLEGQEIVSASRGASLQPNAAMDSSGHLHLGWIDTAGFNRYQVIYASNSPQAKETLNVVTTYEVVDKILSAVMNVLSAIFFLPMVLSWVFIPIAWLVIFTLSTREFEISDPRGLRALAIACLLQLGVKVLLFPDLLSQFPFGSQIFPSLSPSLGIFLGQWIFPLFLAVVSAGVAWIYQKRTSNRSLFTAYFIYAAVDSLLTLVIYVALPMAG
jgi:hypothetical protein